MKTRNELMKELIAIQNKIGYQDILTITGFMDDTQLAEHIARYRPAAKAEREFVRAFTENKYGELQ